jgi:protein-tyrosine phosphatase
MTEMWTPGPGILELPDGLLVRGRGLRRGEPEVAADWSLVLLGKAPSPAGPHRWVRWPDFSVPRDWRDAREAIEEARERAATERVEVMCNGGRGRTGTALACLATLAGLSPKEAVIYVRQHYDRHAVEMPWQRLFIRSFR